jgi:hypothetical protein
MKGKKINKIQLKFKKKKKLKGKEERQLVA